MADAHPLTAPGGHDDALHYASYRDRLEAARGPEVISAICRDLDVRFLRLAFTDILGHTKNVELPSSQIPKALSGDVMFDGSSVEGFARVEESDMLLRPDPTTFRVIPRGGENDARVAWIVCDVLTPDGTPFAGDPRGALHRVCEDAAGLGFRMQAGVEAEFFLFRRDGEGRPTLEIHDTGGYFDLTPTDRGERTRRMIVNDLEAVGFEVEAAHHEVAEGQHEIDFRYDEAVATADRLAMFRFIVRNAALDHGLHATFMPKPLTGANGSGMHTHQSLFRDGENAFFDPDAEDGLSEIMLHYLGGLKVHAPALAAITNPLVNSYKRLVPGYEAPVQIAWSKRNRSPLIRVPARRGPGTRVEFRMPDPAANPYLALAAQLAAGLDGIRRELDPGPAIEGNVWEMGEAERARLDIRSLPTSLEEALDAFEADAIIRPALGDHIGEHYLAAKRAEWADYRARVTDWEVERYLATY